MTNLFIWRGNEIKILNRDDGGVQIFEGDQMTHNGRIIRYAEKPSDTQLYFDYLKSKFPKEGSCIFCSNKLESNKSSGLVIPSQYKKETVECKFCGWKREILDWWNMSPSIGGCVDTFSGALSEYDLNDKRLLLSEIGTFLKKRFSDVYDLSSYRFEEIIEDIFKNKGYKTRLTKKTRDGGADIVILENDNSCQAIVEVKRYAKHRSVGINIVDRLLGAQIRWGAKKAYLITTSQYTAPAEKALDTQGFLSSNLELELWDADRVLKELGCYNENLPALNFIDPYKPLSEQIT